MPQANVAWDSCATGAPTNIMRAFVIASPLVFPLCPVGAWGHLESVPASMNPTAWGGGPDLRLIITTKPKEEDLLVLKEESLTPDVLAKARELVTLIANAKHGPFADDDATTRNTPHFIGVREDSSSAIVACDDIPLDPYAVRGSVHLGSFGRGLSGAVIIPRDGGVARAGDGTGASGGWVGLGWSEGAALSHPGPVCWVTKRASPGTIACMPRKGAACLSWWSTRGALP